MSPTELTQAEFDYERQVRELRKINEALFLSSVRQHELTEQAQKAEQARRASEERLEIELAAMQRLQEISIQMIHEDKVQALYEEILDAAVDIMRSDMASMQIVDEGEKALRLQTWRGFEPVFGKLFELVGPSSNTSCGFAMTTGHRVVVADVETCDFIAGTAALENHRKMGIRAMQSTPLVSRGGAILGMMSTHWRYPHQPSERDLNLLDVLARQAADLIERSQAEESLRQADRRKDEFLAMLGHELRNPLGIISTSAQILRRLVAVSASRAEELRDIDIIERQVTHTSQMLDDLLDISRISTGKIQLKKRCWDLRDIVRQTVEDYRERFVESSVGLELHLPDCAVSIMGDRTRLAQLLGNLLHNANKFTDKGGTVNVKLQAEKQETAALSVADTGMGMEPEALGWVFEPFRQADRTLDRSRGGLGLGLALVKGIVELHSGEVAASSDGVGRGSTFTIQLPIHHAEPAPAVSRVEHEVDNSRSRVLIIEDHRLAARNIRLLLEMSGYTVEAAYSGPDGVELARKFRPDFVLCDIGLPGLDGYGVAAAIRLDVGLAKACFIAVSGYVEDERRAREAGFNAHILKPVDIGELQKLIKSMG
jgi:signal transduction histidine kinase